MRVLEKRVGWCRVSWRHEMVWLCWCKVCLVRVWRGEGSSIRLRGGRRSDSLNSNSRTGVVVSVLIPGCPHSTNSILEQSTQCTMDQKFVTNYQSFCCFKWCGKGMNRLLSFMSSPQLTAREREAVELKEAFKKD